MVGNGVLGEEEEGREGWDRKRLRDLKPTFDSMILVVRLYSNEGGRLVRIS